MSTFKPLRNIQFEDLTERQRRIVHLRANGPVLIKGLAGTGKTTVAMFRAAALTQGMGSMAPGEVLFVTYTKNLCEFVQNLVDVRGNRRIDVSTFHKLCYRAMRAASRRPEVLQDARPLIETSVANAVHRYPDCAFLQQMDPDFFAEEIRWIKGAMITNLQDYLGAKRKGRTNPLDLRRREVIWYVYELYQQGLHGGGMVDFDDFASEVIRLLEERPTLIRRYEHIIVDEAQDMSRAELLVLSRLAASEPKSILLAADTAQKIYYSSFSYKKMELDVVGRTYILSKFVRTTRQVTTASFNFLVSYSGRRIGAEYGEGGKDRLKFTVAARSGPHPMLKRFATFADELDFVAHTIELRIADGFAPDEVIVAHRYRKHDQTNERIIERLRHWGLPVVSDKDPKDPNAITVTTFHGLKGLEYKVVFVTGLNDQVIPGPQADELPEDERDDRLRQEGNLLYVGMTRSGQWLYLTYHGEPSRFLFHFSRGDFRVEPNMKLQPFLGQIRRDDFFFSEQVQATREEEVRQWMLLELAETYGYPKGEISHNGMVRIEHPIAEGKFNVDIAVGLADKMGFSPRIIIETKRPNSERGLEQLKTYMRNCPSAVLGILTNGGIVQGICRDEAAQFKVYNGDIPTADELEHLH